MKKRLKKQVHINFNETFSFPSGIGRIYLKYTRSNIFITLTDFDGRLVLCRSSGSAGLLGKRSKKTTYHAILPIIRSMAEHFKVYKITGVLLYIRVLPTTHERFLIVALARLGVTIKEIVDQIAVPHNGMRSRKVRRV